MKLEVGLETVLIQSSSLWLGQTLTTLYGIIRVCWWHLKDCSNFHVCLSFMCPCICVRLHIWKWSARYDCKILSAKTKNPKQLPWLRRQLKSKYGLATVLLNFHSKLKYSQWAQWCQLESLRVLFYEAKVPSSDGYSTIWKCRQTIDN